jgi:hypothetical protein
LVFRREIAVTAQCYRDDRILRALLQYDLQPAPRLGGTLQAHPGAAELTLRSLLSNVANNNRVAQFGVGLALFAFAVRATVAQTSPSRQIDDRFLTMTLLPGWVAASHDQVTIVTRGKYVLRINPIFTHASGVEGGRFPEITAGMSGIGAVMRDVDQPAGGFECAENSSASRGNTGKSKLYSLYTDSSKTGNSCVFPADSKPVWFGATAECSGEAECTITLDYDTSDVNALPKKDGAELQQILGEVETMLKTLHLKQFFSISRVSPEVAAPGDIVAIYGAGFNIPGFGVNVEFKEFPNTLMQAPIAGEDGTSMTFRVPVSLQTMSCPSGKIEVNEWCVPPPANHVNVNDCPANSDGSTNFCGIPIPPNTYHLWASFDSAGLGSNDLPLSITAPQSGPVSIVLLYPDSLIRPDQPITVRGNGFTATGNTIQVGSAIVENMPSEDGKTLIFKAPKPKGLTLLPHFPAFEAFVSNANGKSNPIVVSYR